MHKKYKGQLFIFIMALVMLLAACGNSEETLQDDLLRRAMSQTRALVFFKCESNRNKRYLCKKVEEGYKLTVYNSLGAIIVSEVYPKEPGISWITENVIEIAISTGSPARYVYYVDMDEDKVSDVYFNPILVGDEYVAYMEDGEMILSDIFYTDQQEDLLYMTVVRDFTKTANPMSAIIGIELIDSGNIALTYLTGEDYTEVTEIILIDKNVKLEPPVLYTANRRLWEPEDGSVCSYAWSDIDGDGQPELFVAKQPDKGNGYEIHIFMIVEDGRRIQDVPVSTESSIQADSLPVDDIWRRYSNGVVCYSDNSTYFYFDVSKIRKENRFCREEASAFYDEYGNEITYARWQMLNTAFVQGKILSAEKPVWKEIGRQAGHLSDEELLEELKTSYDEYLLSMENRDEEKIIDSLRLSHAQNEEENDILLREFTKKVQEGESAQIIFLRYTAEHIPVPVYIDYNGEDFYGIWDESEDPYAESACPYQGFRYEYLQVFSETGEDGMIYETAVLTNKEDLSWEDLTGTGDKTEEYPGYLILYGDIETKDALLLATDIVRLKKGNFIKRNGIYLIEDGTQLELLSEMVIKGEEIEPGIDAAIGIYRFCSDAEVRDYLQLGSRRTPFRGGLYGDGHVIVGDSFDVNWSWREWSYFDYELVRKKLVSITIEDAETLKEAEQTLLLYPTESLAISVAAEDADMQTVAELIKQCWEVNHERNHYFVNITDITEQTEESGALSAFLDLFGEEGAALMEQAAEEEDSYISFIRLERVDGLDICTFAVRASEEEQYHLMLRGGWEETEVSLAHLVIPATYVHGWIGTLFGSYHISQVDINFDGKNDLLIHEGDSGGSGGSFCDYRAVVWEKDTKEFVWYPSFPEQLVFLEFNEQRVIDRYQLGVPYQVVCEYGVVDGIYVKTRELIWESHIDTETLSYYEMDVLVEQHDVTDMDWDEVISLYPDLDYWTRG